MRSIMMLCALLGFSTLASAEPAKKADTKPAPAVKVPPMPPQLDATLYADAATAKWEPVSTLPKGAMGALIGTEAADGGMAGWLKFPAGYKVPATWDTHRSSYTVVAGQLTITSNGKKHLLAPGSYAVLTSTDKHELSCGAAECLLIVQHYGPPDMHWVNPADAPKAH